MFEYNAKTFINDVFGTAGAIQTHMPDYHPRTGQTQLATRIQQTATTGGVLLAEASTGCGKSFAYCVPAIAQALATGRRALIVTANKILQEQLGSKDLPFLQTALSDVVGDFKFKVVKGRANYICKRELAMFDTGAMPWPSGLEDEAMAISAWAQGTDTGEQSEAPIAQDRLWRSLSVTGEQCGRTACSFYNNCFAEKALEDASKAHVVVANYDLFFSKLLYGGEEFWSTFGVVILDECHDAAHLARRCFTRIVSEPAIRALATALGEHLFEHTLATRLRRTASPVFEKIANYARESYGRLDDPNFTDISDVCEVLLEVVAVAQGACKVHATGAVISGVLGCSDCAVRKQIRDKAKELAKDFSAFVSQSSDDTAYWMEKPTDPSKLAGATVRLCAAPYYVGDKLRRLVFERYPAVICVSATMTSGGSFGYIRNELGLDDAAIEALKVQERAYDRDIKVETLRIASPFDFKQQAKLVIPVGIPFPVAENEALFDNAAAKAIEILIKDCKGRLLALFTSRRRLNYVADYLQDKCDYPLLVQGSNVSNNDLAAQFRADTNSVLLATRGFWTGLDIAGEALSCLVIDKIPFESFDDPIVDMLKTKHPDSFWDNHYVPRASIALAQGAGRLIRSMSDVGVMVLLDQRIKVKRYGRVLLASMPFNGYSDKLADAGKFLAQFDKATK